ncbi:MAG TPA: M42 family metallopeptidase [Thermotogota bacterium]|jgi:putative aminopeptidase FrvX|nr:M42 family metallopeptidase [Thermotogota bacterium]OQC31228.1 MAG: Aminopeptidase YpdE [Thermotogota bacterium ADurb.Bin062]HNW46290.1 M42 family metallopeptidase [Thermotogota bacterium]HOD91327.1 M42 family metallopeptidase [Thermotogota bacterium]HOF23972.1 M42 family metallopeptidase [Thermotogota bacterium]
MRVSEKHLEYMKGMILELCRIPSPTGFTREIQKRLRDIFEELGYRAWSTRKGSVVVQLSEGDAGKGPKETAILSAHIDTLGAIVRAVKDNGRLRLTPVGGYPLTNIITENCLIHTYDGRSISGTIQLCHSSSHVYKDIDTVERNDETLEVVLDERVQSKKDVEALGIESGNYISFDPRTVLTERGFLKSRHLDDKASVGILITLAKILRDGGYPEQTRLNRKAYLLFTNYEEVGHGGSAGIPEDVEEILVVDMGAVGDDLGTDEHKVSICMKDSNGPYDYEMTRELIDLAKTEKLNYAVDIYPSYGSDAGAALRSGKDIRFALIGPGVSSSHGYERAHIDGLSNTCQLLMSYLGLP